MLINLCNELNAYKDVLRIKYDKAQHITKFHFWSLVSSYEAQHQGPAMAADFGQKV